MNRLPTDTEEKYFLSQEQHGRRLLLKRRTWHSFWQIGIFRLIIATGICFLLLTGLTILVYHGGTMADTYQHGYAFFSNFLIDLGRTSTPSGQDHLLSCLHFLIALITGAVGITLLFAAFTQFFVNPGTARWLSRLGAVCG